NLHQLSSRRRRHQPLPRHSDDVSHRSLHPLFLEQHPEARQGILHRHAAARSRRNWRFPFARPLPLLPVLGSHAHSDVSPHRHLGPRPPHLRRRQIHSLHHGRLNPYARRHSLALQRHGHFRPSIHPAGPPIRRARSPSQHGNTPFPRLLRGLRHQSSAFPVSHLVARRPRRSSHRRLRHARRRAPENGHLRHDSLLPASFSRCLTPFRAGDRRPRHHRHHLRRARR